ncbi:MAG: hypothetical protein OXC63_00935 [Aestuariivita sp.]|nr:hypothetical protein [Aestuariivita sp.]
MSAPQFCRRFGSPTEILRDGEPPRRYCCVAGPPNDRGLKLPENLFVQVGVS